MFADYYVIKNLQNLRYNEKSHQLDEILTDILLREPDFQKVQTINRFFYFYLK